jgi:murein DD-endopeptidase MepM/ murein hydrolase activator NlpD
MLSSRLLVKPCLLFICLSLFFINLSPCWAVDHSILDIWQLKSSKVLMQVQPTEAVVSRRQNQHYTIRKGDTLWKIAKDYKVDVKMLQQVNKITKPELLQIGTRIIIPLENGQSNNIQLASRKRESTFLWPVSGTITSRFGPRGRGFHHGLDIATKAGTPIKAIEAGKVVFAGYKNWVYGNAVVIDHGGGIKAMYAHNRKNLVEEGDWVKEGQAIAEVGSTGRSTGPHVHLEIHVGDAPVNPVTFLRER